MKDIMGLMKQAQAVQARMQEMQEELERVVVEGMSGGGLVRVSLSGKGGMKGIAIDASLLKADEKEILEDLIVTAHEDARRKAELVMEEKMKSVSAGLPLPPGLKLPF
ncbi:MAG TPA: YbaB/EbfC family nucleoid-associated protein [Beijerinckiaceae bacterium]|nr:YbaB/EbfC family nucleoid-associated protein [Beijerinckiaceae bacterium]